LNLREATSLLERFRYIPSGFGFWLGISKLCHAFTKDWAVMTPAHVDNLTQRTNRIVTTNDIRKACLAADLLEVLSVIVNQGNKVTSGDDILQ
jgi:hypothetical protein